MKMFLKAAPLFLLLFCFNHAKSQAPTEMESKIGSDSVRHKVEIEASFPGDPMAWQRYVTNAIMDNQKKLRKSDYGTCIIKFIVDTKGKISNVEATTMQNSRLAKIAVDAILNGPRWKPAMQDGHPVKAYRLQPVTLIDPDEKKIKVVRAD